MFWLGDFKSVVDNGEVAFNEFSMQMKDEGERIEFSFHFSVQKVAWVRVGDCSGLNI